MSTFLRTLLKIYFSQKGVDGISPDTKGASLPRTNLSWAASHILFSFRLFRYPISHPTEALSFLQYEIQPRRDVARGGSCWGSSHAMMRSDQVRGWLMELWALCCQNSRFGSSMSDFRPKHRKRTRKKRIEHSTRKLEHLRINDFFKCPHNRRKRDTESLA